MIDYGKLIERCAGEAWNHAEGTSAHGLLKQAAEAMAQLLLAAKLNHDTVVSQQQENDRWCDENWHSRMRKKHCLHATEAHGDNTEYVCCHCGRSSTINANLQSVPLWHGRHKP